LAHVSVQLYLLRSTRETFDPQRMLEVAVAHAEKAESSSGLPVDAERVSERLSKVSGLLGRGVDEAISELASGGDRPSWVVNSLPVTYWGFLRSPFTTAPVFELANLGLDSDSNASMCAAMIALLLKEEMPELPEPGVLRDHGFITPAVEIWKLWAAGRHAPATSVSRPPSCRMILSATRNEFA
jgi:hypothetical protein